MRSWRLTRPLRRSNGHTAKRIYERLRDEHGFSGGYTVVKDHVRITRTRNREIFVPLSHPPGHAQMDFGESVGVIGGLRMKLHVFCLVNRHRSGTPSRGGHVRRFDVTKGNSFRVGSRSAPIGTPPHHRLLQRRFKALSQFFGRGPTSVPIHSVASR